MSTDGEPQEPEAPAVPDQPEPKNEDARQPGVDQQSAAPANPEEQRRISYENRQFRDAAGNYFNMAQIGTMIVQQGGVFQPVSHGQSGSSSVRVTQVLQKEIDLIWMVYHEPPNYQDALKQLQENHLVILRGRPQVGKRAAAIHLAVNISEGNKPAIDEFPPEVNLLERIKPETLVNRHIYIVDGLLATRTERLTRQDWEGFTHHLKQMESYLIVCARQEVRFPADLSSGVCCNLEPPQVKPQRIVESHLHYYDHDFEPDEIEACLNEPQVTGLLSSAISPASAGYLALRLAGYLHGEYKLDEALLGFAAYSEATVEEWFEKKEPDEKEGEEPDPDEQAFRIALAVFDGAQYSAVQEAGRNLAARLTPPVTTSESEEKKPPSSPLSRKKRRSGRLERARAHPETVYLETAYNQFSEVEIVRLDNPGYQTALLKYLWKEYDDFRDIFLAWLEEYATTGPVDMRTRAALAIGALAQLDFFTISSKIFYPWAKKKDRLYRAALSHALGWLIWDDHHVEDVLGLLRAWSESDKEEFRWAAGRAYALVGLRYPGEAMERWWHIFQKMSLHVQLTSNLTFSFLDPQAKPIFQSTLDAVMSLFLGAIEWPGRFQIVYERLLEFLHHWTEADDEPQANPRLGFPLFLILMSIRVPGPGGENSNDKEKYPPALLELAGVQEPSSAYLTHLTWFLRRGLNNPETRGMTLELLHSWVAYADSDQRLAPALKQIFRTLIDTHDLRERERGRLGVYIRRWAKHPRRPIPLADELVNELGLTP